MYVNLEKIEKWFEGYAKSFDLSIPMIRVKYDHSFEVMRVGERLVDALYWPTEEALTGIAACLLHDAGRFSQYRDFGTYYDGASIDHGDRGFDVLHAEFPADLADEAARSAILSAVKWHNKQYLPAPGPALRENVMPFCRLARDADKLDVFQLVARRMDEGTIGDLLPRHNIDAPLSPALVDEVETRLSGSYKNASSLQDFLLIQLTWALDINYAPSLAELRKNGILDRIRERLNENGPRVQRIIENLFDKIESKDYTPQSSAAAAH